MQDSHDTNHEDRINARHAAALMQARDVIHRNEDSEAGLDRVLHICLDATEAGVAALVLQIEPGRFATLFATRHAFDTAPCAAAGHFLDRPRRICDLSRKFSSRALSAQVQVYRALLSAPLGVDTGGQLRSCCCATRPGSVPDRTRYFCAGSARLSTSRSNGTGSNSATRLWRGF